MWTNLTTLNLPPLNLALRAVLVYFAVLLMLRLSGKRQIGQMGATEFVAILLISNAVQNSMNGGDNSLVGGLLLAAVLVLSSAAISYLTYKSRFCSAFFEGTPTLLIHQGHLVQKHLAREQMNESELRTLLRKQGVHDVRTVETAVLEADGTLSVTRRAEVPASGAP